MSSFLKVQWSRRARECVPCALLIQALLCLGACQDPASRPEFHPETLSSVVRAVGDALENSRYFVRAETEVTIVPLAVCPERLANEICYDVVLRTQESLRRPENEQHLLVSVDLPSRNVKITDLSS